MPSVFTDVREVRILNWIKKFASPATFCRKDLNDHHPLIEFRNFPDERQEEAWVDETARVGQLVSIISVTDLDLEDRGRAVVTIIEGNEAGHFTVDSVGEIHVVRVAGLGQLDRERTSQYQLTVQAEDGGSPSRTNTAKLVVNVNSLENMVSDIEETISNLQKTIE